MKLHLSEGFRILVDFVAVIICILAMIVTVVGIVMAIMASQHSVVVGISATVFAVGLAVWWLEKRS